jgi:hypothetical protein
MTVSDRLGTFNVCVHRAYHLHSHQVLPCLALQRRACQPQGELPLAQTVQLAPLL